MSIPSLSELLRNPWPPEEPTPAARFAPFLLPGEEILWAGRPNVECHTHEALRGANLFFGGGAVFYAVPFLAEYCANLVTGMSIFLLCLSPISLFCLFVARSSQHSAPDWYFAVTNLRILSYDPHNDGPEFSGLSLREVARISVKTDENGCGTIHFNCGLLRLQNQRPFYCIEAVETVAALIMETKQKMLEGMSSPGLEIRSFKSKKQLPSRPPREDNHD